MGLSTTASAPNHRTGTVRIVMPVISNFPTDSRVQKSAEAASAAGYDVVVVWGDVDSESPHWVEADGYRVLATPIGFRHRHRRRDRDAARVAVGKTVRLAPRTRVLRRLASVVSPLFDLAQGGRLSARSWTWWRRDLPLMRDIDDCLFDAVWGLRGDVIHVHDIHPLDVSMRLRARSIRHLRRAPKIIYDAHEHVSGTVGSPTPTRNHWATVERKWIRRVDGVITVSDAIATALVERYALAATPTVALNAPWLESPRGGPSVREAAGVNERSPLVLYSGGLSPHRGVGDLIEAVASLESAHLAIVCVPDVTHRSVEPLRQKARELRVDARVHFVNPVPTHQIVPYLAGADIGVHPLHTGPSNHELALPNKLFEYIHAGLPLVVSDARLMASFVREWGIGEVFASGDARELAAAIERTLARLDEYRTAAAGTRLRETYSWDHQSRGVLALYASVVGERSVGAAPASGSQMLASSSR